MTNVARPNLDVSFWQRLAKTLLTLGTHVYDEHISGSFSPKLCLWLPLMHALIFHQGSQHNFMLKLSASVPSLLKIT